MAIYHLHAKVIGRGQGKSAVAAAAYRAAEVLHSQHQDVVFDYTKKHGVAFSNILLPEHAPAWMNDEKNYGMPLSYSRLVRMRLTPER